MAAQAKAEEAERERVAFAALHEQEQEAAVARVMEAADRRLAQVEREAALQARFGLLQEAKADLVRALEGAGAGAR